MKRLWFGLGMFLVIALGFSGYRWWHSASTTTVSIQPKPVSSNVLGSEINLKTWQTASFTTQQPADWRQLQSTENSSGPIYASYLLTGAGKNQVDQVAVTIGNLGNNTLAEISAVKVRANQPQLYQAANLGFTPAGGIAYRQPQQYELSAFWQHERRYVAVVSSGPPQNKAELDQIVQAIVSNWQWQ